MKHLKEKHDVDPTKVRIKDELPELDGGLYQISSPGDSALPSESESFVDVTLQERCDPEPTAIPETAPQLISGYRTLANTSFMALPGLLMPSESNFPRM
jgi:hypothetical protein